MAGLALIIVIVILATRNRGFARLPRRFWLWVGKYGELIVLLTLLDAADIAGKLLLAPAFLLLFAPSFVLERVAVPLRMPRVAYWAARWFGPVNVLLESGAGAAMYGALALARKPSSMQAKSTQSKSMQAKSMQAIGWLELRANRAQTVRGAGVVAAGLLAALRGDRRRARALFLVADSLARKFVPASARVVARDWLVADAARSGDWREVIRLGRRGRDSLRWSYAVARIGERLDGDPKTCDDWLLRLCWAIAPRRRATLGLLRRALAVPRAPELAVAASSTADELPDALADLAHALDNRFAHDGRSLARTIAAVDAALDRSTTRARVQGRLLALGAPGDAETILSGFRTRLVELLAPLIEDAPGLAGGEERGPTLDQAIEQVRMRLFRDVEAQCKDYGERLKRENALDVLAEWGAWALLRDTADRLLELVPGSELALFHAMYVTTCNFAVFQHNTCKRLTLAHEIFSWLRRHSQSDPSASQLLSKNMRAGDA